MKLWLLVEVIESSEQPSILIDGRRWTLSQPFEVDDGSRTKIPPFCCISYLWGSEDEREPHAFKRDGSTMSTHTIPSLTAAIRSRKSTAFWTDVFCIPDSGPERQSSLESMGFVYSLATEVVICLSDFTFNIMQDMLQHKPLTSQSLLALEQDKWISSVWTYQEIVNSNTFYFVSSHPSEDPVSIDGSDFFSAFGHALYLHQVANNISSFDLPIALPHLHALEDTMADCYMASAYTSRDAMMVLTSLAHKRNTNPQNFIYAALGAISQDPAETTWPKDDIALAEHFMAVCEHKNDYSFIFTMGSRDTDPKRRWRPKPDLHSGDGQSDGSQYQIPRFMRPLLIWHCYGEAQYGRKDEEGRLWLEDMAVLYHSAEIGASGREVISEWIHAEGLSEVKELADETYDHLKRIGFEGPSEPLVTEQGLIFGNWRQERKAWVERILVATQVRWRMGAPGLVEFLIPQGGGEESEYIPCVFIGKVMELRGREVLLD